MPGSTLMHPVQYLHFIFQQSQFVPVYPFHFFKQWELYYLMGFPSTLLSHFHLFSSTRSDRHIGGPGACPTSKRLLKHTCNFIPPPDEFSCVGLHCCPSVVWPPVRNSSGRIFTLLLCFIAEMMSLHHERASQDQINDWGKCCFVEVNFYQLDPVSCDDDDGLFLYLSVMISWLLLRDMKLFIKSDGGSITALWLSAGLPAGQATKEKAWLKHGRRRREDL